MEQIYKKNFEVEYVKLDDDEIIIMLGTYCFALNELSNNIFELLDGVNSLADIVNHLYRKYDVEKDILSKDVLECCNQLLEYGFVQEV